MVRRALQPAWLRSLQLQHLCSLRRWLPDGRRWVRGSVAPAHLGLENLCWVYDNNHITIEGNTRITFTEDVAGRFQAYGWNVLRVSDANDIERIEHALQVFRNTRGRPTIIVLDSHIGYSSPHKHDSAEAHGEPLGEDEVRLVKRNYGWPEDAKFLVPDGVYERAAKARRDSNRLFDAYRSEFPGLAAEIDQIQRRELPSGWDRNLPIFPSDSKGIAGRDASGSVLNVLAQNIPWFLGAQRTWVRRTALF